MIRSEGLFLLLAISITFFVRYHYEGKSVIVKFLGCITCYALTMLPMILYRIEIRGTDSITSRVAYSATQIVENDGIEVLSRGLENYIKFLGWDLIPIFIFFVPIGFFLIFKNRDYKKWLIITGIFSLSAPALYAYSVPALDTRFLFSLYPIFCVISSLAILKYTQKTSKSNIVLTLFLIGIIISSIGFLQIKNNDNEYQLEVYKISEIVSEKTKLVNSYHPESSYLHPIKFSNSWPTLHGNNSFNIIVSEPGNFNSLEEYLEYSKDKGLTHLVLDGKDNRPSFLNEVFFHEEKYPYLEKIEDTSNDYKKYTVKIFEINYEFIEN